MKTTILFLTCFFLANLENTIGQSKFSEIENFLKTLVYIYNTNISKEKNNEKEFEIWLKDTKTNSFTPKTYLTTGSGFLIYTETDYYLVTAAHVAKETGLESIIVFSLDNSIPLVKKLRDIVYEKQKLIWTIHPNADVAVIQLDYESVIKNNLCCFFPFENINYQLNAPFREREVTIYGFPKSLGIGKRISPITKTLKPSSGLIDLQRSDTNSISTFYLLDDPGVSGFSGGPVYELSQEIGIGTETKWVLGNRIVGLVSGTIIDKAGGFTSIVPSFYIKEAIENAPGLSDTVIIRYDNGKTWNLRVFKNGEPWTVISNFDINGNPQEKGTLKNGDGSQYIYDKKNKLIKIKYYENGHLVREEIK